MSYWNNLASALLGVERWGDSYFYKVWDGSASWTKQKTFQDKVKTILENPAALFIFTLLPDLYSLGKYKLYRNDTEVETHPLLELLRNPNPLQTGTQFKWDYMFHRKLGVANMYIDSKIPGTANKMYFLHGDLIEWPSRIKDRSMDIVLSDAAVAEINASQLVYKTKTQTLRFPFEKLQQYFDISNGINGYFSSPSRVDAIYKIAANSENVLQAKNINSEFSRKFLVSGKTDISNTSQLPMGPEDKQSVEDAMRHKRRTIFPTKSQTAINRFIENPSIFAQLDQSFLHDAFVIGKMLNIPKDVIEMLGAGATYENQEKARAMVISYCIQPDADDFCDGIIRHFELDKQGYKLQLDYGYLPFVQALERDRAETWERKANAFMRLVSAGADQAQAAELLGIEVDMFNAPVRLLGSETQQDNGQIQTD